MVVTLHHHSAMLAIGRVPPITTPHSTLRPALPAADTDQLKKKLRETYNFIGIMKIHLLCWNEIAYFTQMVLFCFSSGRLLVKSYDFLSVSPGPLDKFSIF